MKARLRTSSYFRNKWSATATVLMMMVLLGAAFVPVPYVTRSPGPVFDVLGEIDGVPVLQVDGAKTYPTTGMLDMTTVSEAGGTTGSPNVMTAVIGLFDPDASVIPAREQYPNGPPGEEDAEIGQKVFAASQSTALAAAANYLERPVTSVATVFDVIAGGPSEGKLQPGDVIRTVNGKVVSEGEQVGKIVSKVPVGSDVKFEIVRDGDKQTVVVTTESAPVDPEDPDGAQKSVVGIYVDNHYKSDFTAEFVLEDIGGPSAGLVFSMAIVDKLRKQNLLDGRHVAGTGTITAEGQVGPIGGIDKKMLAARSEGAELFLAPWDNCVEVVDNIPDGLTVVPVKTLDVAVSAVEGWLSNRELPTCPVDAGAGDSS